MYIKCFLFFLFCLAVHSRAYANAIDSIRTKEDLFHFLAAHFGESGYGNPGLFRDTRPEADAGIPGNGYKSNNFYKIDIDGNGKTDLVVDGLFSFAVMDRDTGFEMYDLNVNADLSLFINFIQLPDHTTALLYHHVVTLYRGRCNSIGDSTYEYNDTLVYKFHNFVEYHRHPASVPIKKVDLFYETCLTRLGSYPEFEVDKSGLARFSGLDNPADFLYAHIDTGQLNEFWRLLAYMDPASLKDKYQNLYIADAGTTYLTIYFADGSVKKIEDYGFAGTMGMRSIENIVFNWKKADIWQSLDSTHTADTSLVEDPTTFLYDTYFHSNFQEKRIDSSFIQYEERHPNRHITFRDDKYTLRLFPDHHFVYTYSLSPDIDFAGDGIPDRLLSIGNWTQDSDIITLRWDGYKTLAATRDKKEWGKYFVGDMPPKPYRIQYQQFLSKVK